MSSYKEMTMMSQLAKRAIPLKPANARETDGQWQAIYDTGEDILVSASAGSGKTSVLVKRVIEHVKMGVNIDELLVVTFTEAAAKEMKDRIARALRKEVNQAGTAEDRQLTQASKQHLSRQISKVTQAHISTLHSFCLKVIRRFYYLIDMDPVFRLLADDTERMLLKEDVLEEVLEEWFESEQEPFHTLVRMYASDRSLDALKSLILELYEFSVANPSPKGWLANLPALYQGDQLVESPTYQHIIAPKIASDIDHLLTLLEQAQAIGAAYQENKSFSKFMTKFEPIQDVLEQVNIQLSTHQLEALEVTLRDFQFPMKRGGPRKDSDEEMYEALQVVKDIFDQIRDRVTAIHEQFFAVPLTMQLDQMKQLAPIVQTLTQVTLDFSAAYSKRKAEINALDFNDLEQLTLQILATEDMDGNLMATEASRYYREFFAEVMIDEYQDINKLQETILTFLAEEAPGNRFMVGDVKQSIYGFRQADPSLFLEKYQSYQAENKQSGTSIILAENFRSNEAVIAFVNLIFMQLMDETVGEMTYDESAALVQGMTDFPMSEEMHPELLIYEQEGEEATSEDAIRTSAEGEFKLVASRIQELIEEEFLIYDKELQTMRPIKYRDIAILTPTKSHNLLLQETCQAFSIPVALNQTENYFQTTELLLMMSLLKVIDNPRQDIPLAAVLRSPIVGLDEETLTQIRIADKNVSYFDALKQFAELDEQPEAKTCREFLNQLTAWRDFARDHPLTELIWRIYDDTGFLNYVGGLPAGSQRKANLHALYERAAVYEASSFKGLFHFIRFIEKMKAQDKDLAEASHITDEDNAVRVMTIHGSKGLEFPAVFVCNLARRHNISDAQGAYTLEQSFGFGTDYIDVTQHIRYPTWMNQGLSIRKKNQLLSEQMRVLYVALTRAEQKLFLVGSYKTKEKAIETWQQARRHEDLILPDYLRTTGQTTFLDWIGYCLIRHRSFNNHELLEAPLDKSGNHTIEQFAANFDITFKNEQDLLSQPAQEVKHKEQPVELTQVSLHDPTIQQAIDRMMTPYTHQSSTETTSYQSVSELKRLFEVPDDGQMVKLDISAQKPSINRYVQDELADPSFIQAHKSQPTASDIGQVTHLLLQSMDLTNEITLETVLAQLTQLADNHQLDATTTKQVPIQSIVQFFQTDFGQELLQQGDRLQTEKPFSLLMAARDIFEQIDVVDDYVLIHGIVDGYFETEEGIVLYDYKTDRISYLGEQKAKAELRQKYSGQLNLYKQALEVTLNKPVVRAVIISLDLVEAIDLI